jgi:hypothetical protein
MTVTDWFLYFGVPIAAFLIFFIFQAHKIKQDNMKKIRDSFGKRADKKYIYEEYENISHGFFLQNMDENNAVDDITWNDLNMDDVYQRINNCDSTMGEEILYAKLHYAKQTKEEEELLEKRIAFCEADDEKRYHLEETLSKLGKRDEAYYIPSFIQTVEDFAISNLWVYQMLRILLVVVVVAAVVFHNIYALSAFVKCPIFSRRLFIAT